MITGSGAVGSPLRKPIRSGKEKNPASTKNKKETLFKVSKSLNEVAPMIIKIIPNAISPTTKAKVSKMVIASAEGLEANASLTNSILNSDESIDRYKGSA